MKSPEFCHSTMDATQWVLKKAGPHIKLATPLGLGKPNCLLNELYRAVCERPEHRLDIYTALSLTPPSVKEDFGRRFFEPFSERQWGKDYPVLNYFKDAIKGQIPENVTIHEFYLQSGAALKSEHLQRHYQSVNYTHVPENIFRGGVNVVVQLVAKQGDRLSLSCNPDLTLDVVDLYRKRSKPLLTVAVVHPDLPFLPGEGEVGLDYFDLIVDAPETHELFALPREPISCADHLIGLHASQLVEDGGTIQVGIGSLSEAIGAALVQRKKANANYQSVISALDGLFCFPTTLYSNTDSLSHGLYGLTEMLTDVFMHLRRAGILVREVGDEHSNHRTFLHGAFYLGSKELYQWLRDLSPEELLGLRMTRVSKVNDLYDANELILRRQRVKGRFFNTCMQVSLLGEAMSETLANGVVVSGIGGQYNFVAMAQELEGGRSVLMLRSTYHDGKKTRSNIVWEPGHVSIPRHLRDIVVTEYGVADVRGKSDEETIKAILNIADSRFQMDLLSKAKAEKKIHQSYQIPQKHQNNFPELLESFRRKTPEVFFRPFPFGSDFTAEEERIAVALQKIKTELKESKLKVYLKSFRSWFADSTSYELELERMRLKVPKSLKEKFYQKMLVAYLES